MSEPTTSCKFFVPDGLPPEQALARVTHLAIGAHPDDLEFMAIHGILECYNSVEQWFGGVTCTDGAGSSRRGSYHNISDQEMVELRAAEQQEAASLGKYAVVAQLAHPSSHTKDPKHHQRLVDELATLFRRCQPRVLYSHQPFDKHSTHLAVFSATLAAIRSLPAEMRPKRWLGCEVWRGLDWLPETRKVSLDVSAYPELSLELIRVFDSQISGGKGYDRAVVGRRFANATFLDAHSSDEPTQITYAVDLSEFLRDETLSVRDFARTVLMEFEQDIMQALTGTVGS
ncbi:MAG: PIG-L deacetylase family protein [Verrucomicrobiales bacterium]